MKTSQRSISMKALTGALLLLTGLAVTNCAQSSSNNTEKVLESVPQELKDSAVLKNDEENALDKLNSVIDTAAKKE